MDRIQVMILVLLAAYALGCGENGSHARRPVVMLPGQEKLVDGFYAILEEVSASDRFEISDRTGQLVASEFGTYVVPATPDVRLRLAAEPMRSSGERGRTVIDMLLVDSEARELQRLTRSNVGNRVAIIVQGVVVSAPVVRDVVTGPRCQIHCIDEDRCDEVMKWLQDNVERKLD